MVIFLTVACFFVVHSAVPSQDSGRAALDKCKANDYKCVMLALGYKLFQHIPCKANYIRILTPHPSNICGPPGVDCRAPLRCCDNIQVEPIRRAV